MAVLNKNTDIIVESKDEYNRVLKLLNTKEEPSADVIERFQKALKTPIKEIFLNER